MPSSARVILAVFKREFFSYFSSPTGYVFITLFVFLSAIAAFWQEAFFQANLANLDQLNSVFPYLLVFLVPAITMGLWSAERSQGTDELLLTLPVRDFDLTLGKYLAGVAIYSVALIFSLSHVVVLSWLGSPDFGLMVANYFGYWLMGAALIAAGMLASQLTHNLTVAFILGAIFTAVPVFARHAGAVLTGDWQRAVESLSFVDQFRELAAGIVTFSAVLYFAAFALAMLYLNVLLVGRRRWTTGAGSPPMRLHTVLRAAALLIAMGAATLLAARFGARLDVTSEQLHSLSGESHRLLAGLDPRQPVFIQAYISPEVPRSYLEVRSNLLSFLREYDAVGREKVSTRITETIKYSPEARDARERYGIEPYRVPPTEESGSTVNDIYLGLVFTCGTEEFVIPFFDRGLPVEYELVRSIRVVSRAGRRKIGFLETGVKLFGGFDFQSRRQQQDWSIVAELRKQYEVVRVQAGSPIPEDLDVLVVAQPTTLTAARVEAVTAYAKEGKPLLLLVDPMPGFDLNLAPQRMPQNPLAPSQSQPAVTDVSGLLKALGVAWRRDRIAWDTYNPHPQLRDLPPEFVFVGRGSGAQTPFHPEEPVTRDLQELVLLYPGVLAPDASAAVEFRPLLTTGKNSGSLGWNQLVTQTLFGLGIARGVEHEPQEEPTILAARVRGKGDNAVNAIVIADIDLMGEQFFELRRRGLDNLAFDNVTFLLNAVDDLAGDDSFIVLRSRRPRHRTLEAVEERTRVYEAQRLEEIQKAETLAQQRLAQAQARFDAAVRAVDSRTDVDEQTKQIMINNIRAAEERKLQVARQNIEDEKQAQIEDARATREASVRRIQSTIKLLAVALPPVPAFLLFVLVSIRRLQRERLGVTPDRLVQAEAAG
jgi:ABC-2 type transport system permease protein